MLLRNWGYASKVAQKGFVNPATAREKLWFKKISGKNSLKNSKRIRHTVTG